MALGRKTESQWSSLGLGEGVLSKRTLRFIGRALCLHDVIAGDPLKMVTELIHPHLTHRKWHATMMVEIEVNLLIYSTTILKSYKMHTELTF
jgi:hypothetical protein